MNDFDSWFEASIIFSKSIIGYMCVLMFVEECKLILPFIHRVGHMVYTINKNVDVNYLLYYPCGPKLEDDQSHIILGLWSFKHLSYAIFVELPLKVWTGQTASDWFWIQILF